MKRARICWRKKVRRERPPWLPPMIREDAAGMRRLRHEAYDRSGGKCECGCGARIDWYTGHLHHVVSRARGGSDEIGNLLFITPECHKTLHGKLHWTRSA